MHFRRFFKNIVATFFQHPSLSYFLVFFLASVLFLYFHSNATFADPDSYYHTKIALLIRDTGIVQDFPWLQFTVLKEYYIDHHFLYHVLLVPFVTFFPPLVGMKVATLVFASAAITMFFWLLRSMRTFLA